MRRVEIPVLVVGAGPVGLSAAILLARQGIASRIVDRRPGPHRAPQAHVVNPRTLEIYRAAGIDVGVLRAQSTPPADGSHVRWVTTLAGAELGCLPYERQGDDALDHTPTPLLNLSQHRLEPLQLEHLRTHAGVAPHYGHVWTALEQDGGGVTARIRDLDRDDEYEVRSRWLLAADGAGSRIRSALGIAMDGPERLQSFVMIHVAANLRPLVRERPAILYWTMDPSCLGCFVAHDIDRTWVFMHPFDPDMEPADRFTEAVCAEIVQRAVGTDVALTVLDVSPWTMTAQVAARWRAGRVFLVGDSAHRFPPAGGMGMNTGVQDAHNLAWKLAAVDDARADTSLLDSYEAERRPIAERNAGQSFVNAARLLELVAELGLAGDAAEARAGLAAMLADPAGRARIRNAIDRQQDHFDMLGLQLGIAYETGALIPDGSYPPPAASNPVRDHVPTTRPGARLPHAWVVRDGRRCSMLDLVADDAFTLIAGAAGDAWPRAAARCGLRCLVAGLDFADPDGRWRRVCEIDADGALLVRPDQHVAWRVATAPRDPETALAAALAAVGITTTVRPVGLDRRQLDPTAAVAAGGGALQSGTSSFQPPPSAR